MKISRYLSLAEATYSKTAKENKIKNEPNEEQIAAMKYVATELFDPCREFVGGALHASSFFRSVEVNKAIGGSSTSQHWRGQAIDIDCDRYGNGTNMKVFRFIIAKLNWDQLIYEYGDDENPDWVHVSIREDGKNRRQILRKRKGKGYEPFS